MIDFQQGKNVEKLQYARTKIISNQDIGGKEEPAVQTEGEGGHVMKNKEE